LSTTPFSELIKQAAEAKYTVVPESRYAVVCRDATATKSSTQKDMIKLTVKIVAGPQKGNNVLTQQTLSPDNANAVAIFLKFLDAFGLDSAFLEGLPPGPEGGPNIPAVAAALKGRVAMADVGVHQWNDEDRNDVKKFYRPKPEEEAAIREALAADGVAGDPFGAPSASGGGDPFGGGAPAPSPMGAGGEKPPF
jgi:hypothetical protein